MIVYTPLWETLKRKGLSTYALRNQFGISGSTVQRLRKNMSVSTNTLDDLCNLLDCPLRDVAEHRPIQKRCDPH
jgi:putative transcriptional regulator